MIISTQAFAQLPIIALRCEQDALNPAQAKLRAQWYFDHYPEEILLVARTESGDDTYTQTQANAWFFDLFLSNRTRQIYPTFGDRDLGNPFAYYAYPNPKGNMSNAANKPTTYRWIGSCYCIR